MWLPAEQPQYRCDNEADDDAGGDRKIKPEMFPFNDDIPGQPPKSQLGDPGPKHPQNHEQDPENDEKSLHSLLV